MTLVSEADNSGSDSQQKGYVYIIGAGPGDPELLTIKAERVLREADVILYDDLVNTEIVAQFDATKIYTGKRKDCHHFEQEAINEEIIRHALQGKKVARLKGGDPFIFGRGGEEIEALRQHGIRYEIIPGITAAHGASAYAEIPLTMRKISSSVVFCTGHPANKIQVPDADTLVYYMVASTVHDVLDAVIKKGWDADTMVAIVQNATRYNQKVITSTLGALLLSEKAVYSPALLVIGETVKQFVADNWYSRKKKVLILGEDPKIHSAEEYVKVFFPAQLAQQAQQGFQVQDELPELDIIDEIYISSLPSLRNFRMHFLAIPDHIAVTTADPVVNAEYLQLFGV